MLDMNMKFKIWKLLQFLHLHLLTFDYKAKIDLKAIMVYDSQIKWTHSSSLGFRNAYFHFKLLLICLLFTHPVSLIIPTILKSCFICAVFRRMFSMMRKLFDKFGNTISRGMIYDLSTLLIAAKQARFPNFIH